MGQVRRREVKDPGLTSTCLDEIASDRKAQGSINGKCL